MSGACACIRSLRGCAALGICVALSFALTVRAGDDVPWEYAGAWGPEYWGTLSPQFSACSEGRSQSPVDIVDPVDVELPELEFSYHWKLKQVVHNGYAIVAAPQPGSWMVANGHHFELNEIRFRTPSENRIDGKKYPLEAQFMHRDAEGELAVVAVFFEEGEANPSVGKILASAPWSKGGEDAARLRLTERELLPQDRAYYLYRGSLTTPPCTERVRWFVMRGALEVSAEQIAAFVQIAGSSARDPQPLHSRLVVR